ncbi:MAG TPA: recombination mediator RecR [Kiritimatiellia bacterium]|nr:recombination mediator RecR [Kiritimatiellia bacterium]
MNSIESLERLKQLLGRLPGVGKRSAERMAVAIARNRDGYLNQLKDAILQVGRDVTSCQWCGSMTGHDANPCRLCTDTRRDDQVLCVVEDPVEIEIIERTGTYRGRYFALMGKISPVRGETPATLRLKSLWQRIHENRFSEVILALNSDVESDATAHYIQEQLKDKTIKITRLARGIPAGSGLAYADPVTLEAALKHRTEF